MFISYEGTSNNYSNIIYKQMQNKNKKKTGGSSSLVDRIIDNINLFSLGKIDVKCYSDELNTIINESIRQIEITFADSSQSIGMQNFKNGFNRTLQTVLNGECFKNQTTDKNGIRRMANMYCDYPVVNNKKDTYYLPKNISMINRSLKEIYSFNNNLMMYLDIGTTGLVFFILVVLFFRKN
tara:strand:+ start:246 stop:788 length:543 start_codon:yes stop_codon:yes gene_type:complete